jgi:hypothetical protein
MYLVDGDTVKVTPSYQKGGVIEDNRGQWDHPGEVTKINSPHITMKGVSYPILGISDTGHQQLMMPGHDYSYYGKSVTEYPMIAEDGTTANKERAERLYKQIAPSSFIDVSNYVNYATGKNRDWYADPRSEEAWKMYLGLNDKPKYIAESKYKNENPAAKFAPNTKFYKIDQEAENQLVDYFKDKLKPGQHLTVSERELESLDNIDKKSGYGPFALFQNFNVGKGQDKQGEYVYYNDTYDFPGPMQMMLKGNPYEFYNKIYLPKGKSKEDFDESYYPNKMMEESMKGWWQKEKGGKIKAQKGVVIRNADGTTTTYDPSSEEYRKLYESGQIGAYDESTNSFYPTGSLPEVTVNAIRPKSFKDFNRRYSDQLAKDIGSDFSAGSFFQALTQPILQYPQAALTYALDPKSNVLPSKALGISEEKHPWLTMLVNGVADPTNLVGMGLADDALKITSKLKGLINPFSKFKQKDLTRANRDAITFSQSATNRTKLQEFRPGQDFSVTNQQARYSFDPEAKRLYDNYKIDNDPNLSIDAYLGSNEGIYGARDYGDMDDVVLVNSNHPDVYLNTAHETTHSRSIRLKATDAEKKIASDAWSPMLKKNDFPMAEEEAFAVQNELRMGKLKDIDGSRVYTEKDIPEIKKGLQEMIQANHPYLKEVDINNFNMPNLIKSLNKIGLGAVVLGVAGKEASTQEKNFGGTIKVLDTKIKNGKKHYLIDTKD